MLPVPKSKVSVFYYRRKLNLYNLSVYSLGDGNVKCYMWGETQGKRGACEIGTCLVNYIMSLPNNIRHVILYSDTCTGQNRNQYVFTALQYVLDKCPHIETIQQKFLTSGHTEMEVDSCHAAIERASQCVDIFSYDDWFKVIHLARGRNPYGVVLLDHTSFLDLKSMANNAHANLKINTKGDKVNWMKIVHFSFTSGAESVQYRYSFEETLQEMLIRRTSTRTTAASTLESVQLYTKPLSVTHAKKKDLDYLCKSGPIPKQYHSFYESIKAADIVDTATEGKDDEKDSQE